jgi:hypothetical protein
MKGADERNVRQRDSKRRRREKANKTRWRRG